MSISTGSFAGNIVLTDKPTHITINSQVDLAIFLAPLLLLTYHQEEKWDSGHNNYKNTDWIIKKSKEWNVHITMSKIYNVRFFNILYKLSFRQNLYNKFIEYIDGVYPNSDIGNSDLVGLMVKQIELLHMFLKKTLYRSYYLI